MKVEIKHVSKDSCSCNFCNKGELNQYHNGLSYPYETVFAFGRSNGNGLIANICKECLSELFDKIKQLSNS